MAAAARRGHRYRGAGVAAVVVGRDLVLVPTAVVFERVENVLTVGVDEVGPRLPQRMNDVVDKSNLSINQSIV